MESIELMPTRVKVTSILKKAIYAGEYKSGEELSLTGVAAQLGISRTPVREAFQSLAAEGLITLRMNRGAVVNSIDRKFVKDCFDVRILMESEAAARAACNGMDVSGLLERLERLRLLLSADDARNADPDKGGNNSSSMTASSMNPESYRKEYEDLNQDIHMSLWNAADNQRLKSYLMELWNGPSVGLSMSERLQHYRLSTDEHIAILQAVRDLQPQLARQAMAQHITRSRDNIMKYYPEQEN